MGVKVREVEGIWRVVVDWKGRRVSRNVGRGKDGRHAARTAAAQIQAKLALGDWSVLDPPMPAPAPILVRDIAGDWLAAHQALRNIRPNTRVNYETALRCHVLPWFGEMAVQDLDVPAVEAFLAAKVQRGGSARFPGRALSRGSLRLSLSVLRGTDRDPVGSTELGGLRVRRSGPRRRGPTGPSRSGTRSGSRRASGARGSCRGHGRPSRGSGG